MRASLSSLALLAASLASLPATAPAASEAQQAAAYRLPVGDAVVTALSDGTVSQDIHPLLVGATPAEIDRLLARQFLRNPVEMSMNAFLIELGDRKILVDTGAGEVFGPGVGGRLAENLAAIGVKPEQITDVLITHAHMDHIGGLARGGKPAFPNATLHLGGHDAAFFGDPETARRGGYPEPFLKTYAQTLGLYPKTRIRPFTGRAEILPGITAAEHPGHTPGAAFYTLTSKGQSLHFIGDTVHVEAVQLPRPAVTITYDIDPAAARTVRQAAFARLAQEAALIAAPHIQFPGVGRLRASAEGGPEGGAEGGYDWVPVEYRNRAEPAAHSASR